jgi:hypothetical protein
MKFAMASLLLLASLLLSFTVPFFAGCVRNVSEAEKLRLDHEEIEAILDKALLSDNPAQEFISVLPRVRSYGSVDSAWIEGKTFYVKYTHGGTVTWIVPPEQREP